jgi:hypothetical protein
MYITLHVKFNYEAKISFGNLLIYFQIYCVKCFKTKCTFSVQSHLMHSSIIMDGHFCNDPSHKFATDYRIDSSCFFKRLIIINKNSISFLWPTDLIPCNYFIQDGAINERSHIKSCKFSTPTRGLPQALTHQYKFLWTIQDGAIGNAIPSL